LAHPDPAAPLALVTDASNSAKGAVLQQRVGNDWQPLAFCSKKFNPAQQKYSTYDRELLAVYAAVKNFRHMLAISRSSRITIPLLSHSDKSETHAHRDNSAN
jgi:cleavage and polyadenylation specificity factor subunit 1